ncbi:MAG: hypothetical protein HY360_25370 [Verrucomicrobia bacterium]|nr:hypothetical protein [Verrucomicrobiota bacterium]
MIDEHLYRLYGLTKDELLCPPEKDSNPKKTLTELFVRPSTAIEYDVWNRQCARLVAPHLRHEQVAIHCPRGFKRLSADLKRKVRRQTILPD